MAWTCKTRGTGCSLKELRLQSNSIEHKIIAKWVRQSYKPNKKRNN
jgi:hypothetical protein